MNKSPFFIVGQHAVIEALRNPQRKVLRVFLTEEAKKNISSLQMKIDMLVTKKDSLEQMVIKLQDDMIDRLLLNKTLEMDFKKCVCGENNCSCKGE